MENITEREQALFWPAMTFFAPFLLVAVVGILGGCEPAHAMEGMATFYTTESTRSEGNSGVVTANGERYNAAAMTCALRVPMKYGKSGKHYLVYGHKTGRSVVVRQNDFGPGEVPYYQHGHIVDLTPAAFRAVCGDLSIGKCQVSVQEVK